MKRKWLWRKSREVERILSLGAAGVIPKPFDPMSLVGDVKRYLS